MSRSGQLLAAQPNTRCGRCAKAAWDARRRKLNHRLTYLAWRTVTEPNSHRIQARVEPNSAKYGQSPRCRPRHLGAPCCPVSLRTAQRPG